MRLRSFQLAAAVVIVAGSASAGEIREFDIKTIERLGNELTEVSQRADRGATDAVRKRAVETAKAALRGKLFNIRYDYVVLDDPDGSGFLVYALGRPPRTGQIVLSGHFRVTVSPNGEKVERLDALSYSLMIADAKHPDLPKGVQFTGNYMTQLVSNKPVETIIYTSNLAKIPIVVGTPDGKVWIIENGRMSIDRSKPGNDTLGGAAKMGLKQVPK